MNAGKRNKPRRSVLLLDSAYPIEREINVLVKSLPQGERASILRAMILIGFSKLKHQHDCDDARKEDESGSL